MCSCYKLPSNFELYTHWQRQYGQSCGKASEYNKQEYTSKTSRSKIQQYHNTNPYKWGLFEHIINVPQKFNRFGCCMQHVLVSQINDLPLRYVAAEHFNGFSSVFLLRFFSDFCYICIVFCQHVFWFLFIYLFIYCICSHNMKKSLRFSKSNVIQSVKRFICVCKNGKPAMNHSEISFSLIRLFVSN